MTSPSPTCFVRALREAKSDQLDAAAAAMVRARGINPQYFEVDRVEAFFASMRKEIARATTLYRSALSNYRTDEERYWVNYFYAAHLTRTAGDIPEAINLAERTHAFFGRYETAHCRLGNYYAWSGRFEEGEELIEWALQRAPTTMSEQDRDHVARRVLPAVERC